jgi:hypothetical protein
MSENEVERIFRDSRINLIVEGANEVMQSYIFGYGGKQLAERLLGIKQAMAESFGKTLKNSFRPAMVGAALPVASEVYLGIRRKPTKLTRVSAELQVHADRAAQLASELTFQFKSLSKKLDVKILDRQAVQARMADIAILLHAWVSTLAKLDSDISKHGGNGSADLEFQRDKAAALHFFELADVEITQRIRELYVNADETMLSAADAALKYSESLPASDFVIPEKSPTDLRGKGRTPKQTGIKQFPGTPWQGAALDSNVGSSSTPAPSSAAH